MTKLNLNAAQYLLAKEQNYDPHKWTDKAKPYTPERVEPRYQAKENGEWVAVRGVEIGGGCLRYTVDGWGKVAQAGDWRQEISEEWVAQVQADQVLALKAVKAQMSTAKKWWIFILIMLFLLIVVFPLLNM